MATKLSKRKPVTKPYTKPQLPVAPVAAESADEIAEYLSFGTPEQLQQDEIEWRAIVAKTTPEQLETLEKMSRDSARKKPADVLTFDGK